MEYLVNKISINSFKNNNKLVLYHCSKTSDCQSIDDKLGYKIIESSCSIIYNVAPYSAKKDIERIINWDCDIYEFVGLTIKEEIMEFVAMMRDNPINYPHNLKLIDTIYGTYN